MGSFSKSETEEFLGFVGRLASDSGQGAYSALERLGPGWRRALLRIALEGISAVPLEQLSSLDGAPCLSWQLGENSRVLLSRVSEGEEISGDSAQLYKQIDLITPEYGILKQVGEWEDWSTESWELPGHAVELDLAERGLSPAATKDSSALVATCEQWSYVLIVSAMKGFCPGRKEFKMEWLYPYAEADPEVAHFWWSCGYLRSGGFTELETRSFKEGLEAALDDPFIRNRLSVYDFVKRKQPYMPPENSELTSPFARAVEKLDFDLAKQAIDLSAKGRLGWTVYKDRTIGITSLR